MPSAGGCEEDEDDETLSPPPPPPGASPLPASPAPKLCGYLQKLSGKGPLRGFRSRWFVFDAHRCSLYYFKGPQEASPLGRLDVATAAFNCHLPPSDAAGGEGTASTSAGGSGLVAAPGTAFELHSPDGSVAILKVEEGLRAGARADGCASSSSSSNPLDASGAYSGVEVPH